ncbi:septin-interacting protein 1 [Planococcus citri]|uniref:septin-interacting protein 1 n=1 Tax=Planococcus citri TaxID=170843 RepID=UPI0031F92A20
MADEEFIKFEITDDDLNYEFAQHRTRRLTKNEQTYGIWADKDSDASDEEPRDRKHFKGKKNYQAPVNFIAGGIHQPGAKPTASSDDGAKKDDEDEPEIVSDSSEEELVRPSFGRKNRPSFPDFNEFNPSEMAGFRKATHKDPNITLVDKGVGNWEKHTKGIGAKLLLQMGFQPGKGLGKDLQGIQAPIEAHLRKGRGAIGAYGPEKKTKVSKIEKLKGEDIDGEKMEKSERTSLWRKEGVESKKKIRYVYKSVDEVIEESKKPGKKKIEISELSKVKVIDMTGPEQRVLSGYHAISGVQKPAEEWEVRKDKKFTNFSMPELQHNLNLLVDVSEQAIIDNDKKMKQAEERLKILDNQAKTLSQTLTRDKMMINNFHKLLDMVNCVVKSSKDKTLTLKLAEEIFSSMKENHFNEFCMYEVPVLAVNIVRPLLKEHLESWKPLEEPTKPIPEFLKWRTILQLEDSGQTLLNPYYKLMWDVWVPCVRSAAESWQCRQWSPMVDFIMSWVPFISKGILENVLQDIILRRIQQDVDEWNPLTDCVPIHSWIYPWIRFLGKNFETSVYPTIRHKLSKALISWHPSDGSARLMLQPWMSVFEPGEMNAFLVNNIVPKLRSVLLEFVINPHQQCLDNWKWVMEWAGMISPHTMAQLLDQSFFPKWLQTLNAWLHMNPDNDQVNQWLTGWKNQIPDEIKTQPIVNDHIRSAMNMISLSRGGPAVLVEERKSRIPNPKDSIEDLNRLSQLHLSMKDRIQMRCEEKGVLWIPVPNRYMEAKQVYKCGKLHAYIDGNIVFVSQGGGSFTPMSWQEMLENAV